MARKPAEGRLGCYDLELVVSMMYSHKPREVRIRRGTDTSSNSNSIPKLVSTLKMTKPTTPGANVESGIATAKIRKRARGFSIPAFDSLKTIWSQQRIIAGQIAIMVSRVDILRIVSGITSVCKRALSPKKPIPSCARSIHASAIKNRNLLMSGRFAFRSGRREMYGQTIEHRTVNIQVTPRKTLAKASKPGIYR